MLLVLTDYTLQQTRSHADLAAAAARGGADVVEVRQKGLCTRHLVREVEATRDALAGTGTRLLLNDHADVALALGLDGVHLGPGDLPIGLARRILGPDALVGAVGASPGAARQAEGEGASYVAFGPVYATASKRNASSARGLDALAAVAASVSIPVLAVAGITPERVAEVVAAGARGVAVLGAVCLAADPEAATRAFRTALDAATRA